MNNKIVVPESFIETDFVAACHVIESTFNASATNLRGTYVVPFFINGSTSEEIILLFTFIVSFEVAKEKVHINIKLIKNILKKRIMLPTPFFNGNMI